MFHRCGALCEEGFPGVDLRAVHVPATDGLSVDDAGLFGAGHSGGAAENGCVVFALFLLDDCASEMFAGRWSCGGVA